MYITKKTRNVIIVLTMLFVLACSGILTVFIAWKNDFSFANNVTFERFATQVQELIKKYDILDTADTADDGGALSSSPYATKRVIVSSKADVNSYGAIACVEGYNNLHIFQYATEQATQRACEYFDSLHNIDGYLVDSVITAQSVEGDAEDLEPNDSYSYSSWGATAMGVDSYSKSLEETVGASNLKEVVVAVLDSGLDSDHSWFVNRVSPYGKNFSDSTSETACEYEDVFGHGTHVSGIICDLTLSNVKILPIKVINDEGNGRSSEVILGINYVRELKAAGVNVCAINLSLTSINTSVGSERYNLFNQAITDAYNEGILSVVGAGNNGVDVVDFSPANVEKALTVSAVGLEDDSFYHPFFSNYGQYVDVCAPGVDIVSAQVGGGTVSFSGTSMATPHVSAAVALLASDSKNYTISQIEELLKENAIDLGEEGWDSLYGEGLVNLQGIKPSAPNPPEDKPTPPTNDVYWWSIALVVVVILVVIVVVVVYRIKKKKQTD